MPIAAICERCKRRYQSNAIAFGPHASQSVWMNTAVGTCSCGGDIVLIDGGIDAKGRQFYLRSAVEALVGPAISRDDLRWLYGVVEEAKSSGLSSREVAQRIEAERPVFAALVKLLRDPATQSILTIITILFMIAQMLQQGQDPQHPVDADAIAQRVLERIEHAAAQEHGRHDSAAKRVKGKSISPPKRSADPGKAPPAGSNGGISSRLRRKGWKNARCPCGSGRRYSECHGK